MLARRASIPAPFRWPRASTAIALARGSRGGQWGRPRGIFPRGLQPCPLCECTRRYVVALSGATRTPGRFLRPGSCQALDSSASERREELEGNGPWRPSAAPTAVRASSWRRR